jgi:hypothetical protein
MNVIEDNTSRLDDARKKALNVIKNSSAKIMILTASDPPEIILNYSSNRDDLNNAVKSIKSTDLSNGIEETMRIASSSVTPSGTIILISDGAFDYIPSETDNFKFIRAGKETSYNIGITDFYLREKFQSDSYELYVAVTNFSQDRVQYLLNISNEELLIETVKSTSSPGETTGYIFQIKPAPDSEIVARLDIEDSLLSDNRASAFFGTETETRVLLLSPGNFFLEKALESLPGIQVDRDRNKSPDLYDLIIYDRIPPPPNENTGRFIYIDVLPAGLRSEKAKIRPQQVTTLSKHPVLESVDFSSISILKAWSSLSGPQIYEIVTGGNTGLLYASETKYLKFLYLPFDLTDSDLPLQSTFPVLMKNALQWLSDGYKKGNIMQFPSGEHFFIGQADPRFEESEITDPRGNRFKIKDNFFTETLHTGLYKMEYGEKIYHAAININNRDESDISSRFPEITEEDREKKTGEYKFPVITFFLILSLLLLSTEWLVQEDKW